MKKRRIVRAAEPRCFRWALFLLLWAASAFATEPVPAPAPLPPESGSGAVETPTLPVPAGPARLALALRGQLERDFLARHAAGDYAGGIELLEKWRAAEPAVPAHPYNLACLKSLDGRPAEAIEDLRAAIALGWVDFRHMERDADLVAARAHPDFAAIRALNEPAQRRRADRLLAEMRRQLVDNYLFETDPALRLVFAAGVDSGALETVRTHLGVFARALQATLFRRGLEQYVAVVVPDERTKLPGPAGGFYATEHRVLVSRTVGREMNHEFTHAMHHADMEAHGQRHPIWIIEGFAVLFEGVHLEGDRYVLDHTYRLNELQAALRRNRSLPFADLAALDGPAFMKNAMVAYPQAGYVFRYLHAQGLLERWYDAYTRGFAEDATGLTALQAVLEKELPEIESDWRAWVMAQRPTPVRVGRRTPFLGVSAEAHRSGLLVRDIVPGSPLSTTGIAAGDVIETIAGRRVTDPLQLVKIVSERAIGERLDIEFRRNGERFIVRVALAERPPNTR